jgi:hypothetical protein
MAEKRDDEDQIEYARRMVERGDEGERIRFQMSLSAGTIAEMAERAPSGTPLQTLVRMYLGQSLLSRQPQAELTALADEVASAADNLQAIRDSVEGLVCHADEEISLVDIPDEVDDFPENE